MGECGKQGGLALEGLRYPRLHNHPILIATPITSRKGVLYIQRNEVAIEEVLYVVLLVDRTTNVLACSSLAPKTPIDEMVEAFARILLVLIEGLPEDLHHHLAGHVETLLAVMITIILVGLTERCVEEAVYHVS